MKPVNAVTPAASAVAASIAEDMESGFLPEDKNYRLTGKFTDDEKDEKDETSAAANETEEKESTEVDHSGTENDKSGETTDENADTAAASAAASTQEKEGKGPDRSKFENTGNNRLRKLSKENQTLKQELARLQGREEGRSTTQGKREDEQNSQATTEGKRLEPKIDDVDPKTGKAKYATWNDYQKDLRAWDREQLKLEIQADQSKTQQTQAQQAAEAEIGKALAKKFETSRTKYKDFDDVALNPDLVIPKGSVADVFLLDSDHAGDVLYHLGQHPEILEGFYGNHDAKTGRFVNKLTPQRQFRKLMEIEAEVSGAKAAPGKKITQAPRPPNQVDGKNAVTKSAREQALEDGDAETYRRDANASDPRLAAVRVSRAKG